MQLTRTDATTAPTDVLRRARELKLERPPVDPSAYPSYPSCPALDAPPGFTRTTHVLPAAYPRMLPTGTLSRWSEPFSTRSDGSEPGPSVSSGVRNKQTQSQPQTQGPACDSAKLARQAQAYGEAVRAIKMREDAESLVTGTAKPTPAPLQPLFMAAERWQRTECGANPTGTGITLVVTHGSGLIKEHGHEYLRKALSSVPTRGFGTGSRGATRPSPPDAVRVDDVWFLDDPRVGCSVDLNAGRLGAAFSVLDAARDVANFVGHVMPGPGKRVGKALGWHDAPSSRKVVGVAHSYSGSVLVTAAAIDPGIMSALFLIEPTITSRPEDAKTSRDMCYGAAMRKQRFSSVEAASEALGPKLLESWHPTNQSLFLSHGLVPAPTEAEPDAVELATPSWAEQSIFADYSALKCASEAFGELHIPVGILQGDRGIMTGETSEQLQKRAYHERIQGNHYLPQIDPDKVGDAVARFIGSLGPPSRQARL
ncbi:hypothetical protein Q5752_004732 [Cryptotrichosporon argae]